MSADEGDFRVRPLVPGDDDMAVLELLNSAFGRTNSLEWYQWKHRHAPWGQSEG